MMNFKQGFLTNKEGITQDILVKGSKAHELAEFKTMVDLGIIEE